MISQRKTLKREHFKKGVREGWVGGVEGGWDGLGVGAVNALGFGKKPQENLVVFRAILGPF